MNKGQKSNTFLLTILGGMIVGLALLLLGCRTDLFTSSQDPGNKDTHIDSQEEPLPFSFPSAIKETPDADYLIAQEQVIGKYLYRIWRKEGDLSYLEGDNIGEFVTLSLLNEPGVNIEEYWGYPARVDLLSGRDITGEGNPDLIIETYSGGAHCCFQFFVLDLGESSISRYLETLPSNCPGEFKDLDYDGSYEFITCDDIFAYSYCSFASSPTAWVVMKFVDGAGYYPATPDFKHEYSIKTRITADVSRAEQGQDQDFNYWDKNEKVLCPAIQVAVDYLYIGEAEKAEQEFRRLYTYPDADTIWEDVYQTVLGSPLYAP